MEYIARQATHVHYALKSSYDTFQQYFDKSCDPSALKDPELYSFFSGHLQVLLQNPMVHKYVYRNDPIILLEDDFLEHPFCDIHHEVRDFVRFTDQHDKMWGIVEDRFRSLLHVWEDCSIEDFAQHVILATVKTDVGNDYYQLLNNYNDSIDLFYDSFSLAPRILSIVPELVSIVPELVLSNMGNELDQRAMSLYTRFEELVEEDIRSAWHNYLESIKFLSPALDEARHKFIMQGRVHKKPIEAYQANTVHGATPQLMADELELDVRTVRKYINRAKIGRYIDATDYLEPKDVEGFRQFMRDNIQRRKKKVMTV